MKVPQSEGVSEAVQIALDADSGFTPQALNTMIQVASLGQQIEKSLKEDILSGALIPGQRISIGKVAKRWGISVTPVRDAIMRLELIGLVRVAPRRGVFVADCDRRTFQDVFGVRIALECLAVESAVHRIPTKELSRALATYREARLRLSRDGDRAFMVEHDHLVHDLILRHCENDRLTQIMEALGDLNRWVRCAVVARRGDSYEQALVEHLRIVRALCKRDAAAARAALDSHLRNSFSRTLNAFDGDGLQAPESGGNGRRSAA
jgi:DNA-binding GntR family transcriptional regulator